MGLKCCKNCHCPSGFSSTFLSSMIILSQVVDMKVGFGQRMKSTIIHDNTCPFYHKEVSYGKLPLYIKYHTILDIIFSFQSSPDDT